MGNTSKINIGIAMGDPNGIGLELVLKTFEDRRMFDFFSPVLFAPPALVNFHKKYLNYTTSVQSLSKGQKPHRGKLNIVPVNTPECKVQFGTIDPLAGQAAVASLRDATAALKAKTIDALVTAPIHKKAIQSDDFSFPGHTQFLASVLEGDSLMLMISGSLRVALVTDHIPVKAVSETIDAPLLAKRLEQFYKSLQYDFGITKPKIAVLGMNPHAGDAGVIGEEDDTVLRPVITQFQEKGQLIYGPYAADSFFGSGTAAGFDGVLAMYHDQGLIPFKTLSFGQGVNFTAGLSAVRTSPDHGTAFEIAGQGVADPESFKAALFAAKEIHGQRQETAQTEEVVLTES